MYWLTRISLTLALYVSIQDVGKCALTVQKEHKPNTDAGGREIRDGRPAILDKIQVRVGRGYFESTR